MTLILGTPDSGKSLLAEQLAAELAGEREKVYIATMIPYGEEGRKRVEKHRRMREGKGFVTIERPCGVEALIPELRGKDCLLECMSNLVGNEMYSEKNRDTEDEVLAGRIASSVCALSGAAANLTVVTNSFSPEQESFDEETLRYIAMTERVNLLLKKAADRVYEKKNGEWCLHENT